MVGPCAGGADGCWDWRRNTMSAMLHSIPFLAQAGVSGYLISVLGEGLACYSAIRRDECHESMSIEVDRGNVCINPAGQ